MPNVSRSRRWVAAAGLVLAAGCGNCVEPKLPPPTVNVITGIRLPARAAASDTVRVVFSYLTANCIANTAIEARQTADGLRFTATTPNYQGLCLAVLRTDTAHVGYVILPQHAAPLRLIFTEPSGGDSVRVVGQ